MLLDAEDEDFSVIEDRKALKSSLSGSGGFVIFTRNNSIFKDFSIFDKVNFAAFLTKYNVYDKKEYAEGKSHMSGSRSPSDVFRDPMFVIRRLSSALMFLSFALWGILIVVWIILIIIMGLVKIFALLGLIKDPVGVYMSVSIRHHNLSWLILFGACLGVVATMMYWLHARTMQRIEILQYYIK